MSHTITIKLNKAAQTFQAGESIGFGIRGGVQYYDRKSKKKEWTNYQAVVFAKAQAQIDFYHASLVQGAIVEVSGRQQKIEVYEGNNGQQISIELLDASLGYIGFAGQPDRATVATQQRPASQGYREQLGVQQKPVDDFDEDRIPF